MNRLQTELQRLYAPPARAGAAASDAVRGLVIELARPADWSRMSRLWQGVQADLELPAPAIAVNGLDGYQLWFSLAQPIGLDQALGFLESLRAHYLGDTQADRLLLRPITSAELAAEVPALIDTTGNWSAFVAPDLAAVFSDEPWLDLPPGTEAQADLLSRMQSIGPADFQRAVQRLGAADATEAPPSPPSAPGQPPAGSAPAAAWVDDPRRFLLQVMNDPEVNLRLRIDAAKALLH